MLNERPHKKLEVWKKSIAFVTLIYEETKKFPREEEFGLKSQLRRAAVSVPSNIAEGLTRKSRNDKLHFLNIAQGSLSEMDAQIEICKNMNYLGKDRYEKIEIQLVEIEKMLSGLSRTIRE